jgi:hypothetical protein
MPVERVGSSRGGQGKAVPVEETAVQLRLAIATAEKAQPSPFPKAKMLKMVAELFEQLQLQPDDGLLVRRIDPNGAVESSRLMAETGPSFSDL